MKYNSRFMKIHVDEKQTEQLPTPSGNNHWPLMSRPELNMLR